MNLVSFSLFRLCDSVVGTLNVTNIRLKDSRVKCFAIVNVIYMCYVIYDTSLLYYLIKQSERLKTISELGQCVKYFFY